MIGNVAAHHAGLLAGLRETAQGAGQTTDIMTNDITAVINAGLVFTRAPLAPVGPLIPIGSQDAPQLLLENRRTALTT